VTVETAGGREFQVASAAQLKDYLLMSVRLKGTSWLYRPIFTLRSL